MLGRMTFSLHARRKGRQAVPPGRQALAMFLGRWRDSSLGLNGLMVCVLYRKDRFST